MGRSLSFVIAVVAAVMAVALLDRDREIEPLSAQFAYEEPVAAEPADLGGGAGDFGGGSLTECIASVGAPDSTPESLPELTPAGVQETAERVEELRELRFEDPVDVRFLTPAEMSNEISSVIDEEADPDELRWEGEALELLGAIPPGSDLLELSRQALDSQVLGLYVPETKELLAVKAGKAGAIEALTVAHEIDHALTDDTLGLPLPKRVRRGHGDEDLAGQALAEGDATLLMSIYALRHIPIEDLGLLDDPSLAAGEDALDDLPYVLQAQLLFPYDAGVEYVCGLFLEGGWEAVDRAYADPPDSTVELLDPAVGAVELADPPPLSDLPPPWRRTLSDQIGAAELSWLFEAPGDDVEAAIPDPGGAAADWRGGAIELWARNADRALAMSFAQSADGSLCEALIAWYAAANPDSELSREGTTTSFAEPGRFAAIDCAETQIRLGIAPDDVTAQSLAAPE